MENANSEDQITVQTAKNAIMNAFLPDKICGRLENPATDWICSRRCAHVRSESAEHLIAVVGRGRLGSVELHSMRFLLQGTMFWRRQSFNCADIQSVCNVLKQICNQ